MASSNGIQNNNVNVNTIDGLTSIWASDIYENGNKIVVSDLVPYINADKLVDLNSQAIRTTYAPTIASDLTNKNYVDIQDANLQSQITSLSILKADKTYVDAQDANLQSQITSLSILKANITYVDAQDALRVPYTGATSTVNLGSQKIQSSATATSNFDIPNKLYVDSQFALTGVLSMNNTWTGTNTFNNITTFNNAVTNNNIVTNNNPTYLNDALTVQGTSTFNNNVDILGGSFFAGTTDQGLTRTSFLSVTGGGTLNNGATESTLTFPTGTYSGTMQINFSFSNPSTKYRVVFQIKASAFTTMTITQNGVPISTGISSINTTYSTVTTWFFPSAGLTYPVRITFNSSTPNVVVTWSAFSLGLVAVQFPAVNGDVSVTGSVNTAYGLDTAGSLHAGGNTRLDGTLVVTGNTSLNGSIISNLNISGVTTIYNNTYVAQDIGYASRASNPFTSQFAIKTLTTGQRMYLGSYYTGGVGAASSIQSSDFWSGADHGSSLLLNPLGGYVGIGTSTPDNALTVKGVIQMTDVTSSQKYAMYSDSSVWQLNPRTSTGGYNSIQGLSMNSSGQVGIGTNAISSLLHLYTSVTSSDQFLLKNANGLQLAMWNDSTNTNIDTYNSSTGARPTLSINPSGGNINLGGTIITSKVIQSTNDIITSAGNIKAGGDPKGSVRMDPGDSNHTGYIGWYLYDSQRTAYMGYADTTNFYFNIELARNWAINVNGGERMRITNNGRFVFNYGGTAPTTAPTPKYVFSQAGGSAWNPSNWNADQGLILTNDNNVGTNTQGLMLSYANSYGWMSSLQPGIAWKDLVIAGATTYVAYYGTAVVALNSGGWAYISDEREKEDVQDLKTSSSLKRVLAAKPKHYKKKFVQTDDQTPVPDDIKERRCIGFIAQEIMESNPHCVSEWEKKEEENTTRLAVNYNDYVVHLIGAVQEQQKQIDNLKEIILNQNKILSDIINKLNEK